MLSSTYSDTCQNLLTSGVTGGVAVQTTKLPPVPVPRPPLPPRLYSHSPQVSPRKTGRDLYYNFRKDRPCNAEIHTQNTI